MTSQTKVVFEREDFEKKYSDWPLERECCELSELWLRRFLCAAASGVAFLDPRATLPQPSSLEEACLACLLFVSF